jgi:acyl-CoA thioesterase
VSGASPVRPPADAASRLVAHLLTRDAFSQWLGIEVLHADVGRSRVRCTVRPEMLNGFGIAHGGVLFSLADSAFAFATNAGGTLSVALDCTVSFPAAVREGDVLEAEAIEETTTNRFGFCRVTVTRGDDVVAHFRGTVYRTTTTHVPPDGTAFPPAPR